MDLKPFVGNHVRFLRIVLARIYHIPHYPENTARWNYKLRLDSELSYCDLLNEQ